MGLKRGATVITIAQDDFEWHREDAWGWSNKFPVYAVADGVTAPAYEEFSFPTGPKQVADLFVKSAIKFAERSFKDCSEDTLRAAYGYANGEVKKLNRRLGGVFSAVGSLAAVKNGMIFGSRLTDCGFALMRAGKIVFKTPEFWRSLKSRKRQGYGIVDGKMNLEEYVDVYFLPYKAGDALALFTDGFEPHFRENKFTVLFRERNQKILKEKILKLDQALAARDAEKYGHERTLLYVRLV